MVVKKAPLVRPKLEVSPFVRDPIHSRLNIIEICTLMSDYRKAYHMTHELVTDFKAAEKLHMCHITPQETMRFISVTLYLMDKLKMYQNMMDLYESFIVNKHIMTRCNPFSMYYICMHARTHPKLK